MPRCATRLQSRYVADCNLECPEAPRDTTSCHEIAISSAQKRHETLLLVLHLLVELRRCVVREPVVLGELGLLVPVMRAPSEGHQRPIKCDEGAIRRSSEANQV